MKSFKKLFTGAAALLLGLTIASCGGNGGGSNKFAQGAGKDITEINDIFDEILNGKYNE